MKRGNLAHLEGDRWRFRLSAGSHPDGRPRVLSRTFHAPNVTAARKIATEVLHEWDAQRGEEAKAKGTLGELVDAYVDHRAKRDSPTTLARRATILRRIRKDLGSVSLARLDARRIDAWVTGLDKTPATAHHYFRVLKAVLEQGSKWDMIPTNPARKASPPEWRKTDTADSMPQVVDVLAMMEHASPPVRLALLVAFTTGVRRGELLGLWWGNVDVDAGVIVVRQAVVQVNGKPPMLKEPKTAKGVRTIALPAVTRDALRAHREYQHAWIAAAGRKVPADGPVFAHLRHDPSGRTAYPPNWLSQEWERLRAKIGKEHLQLKGLRALHASILADAALAPAALAGRMGHAQVSTTQNYYTHALTAADTQAAAILGKALET